MVEWKIQAECIKWFRNDFVDGLLADGLIELEQTKQLRMLYHGNQNELPLFTGVKMPAKIRAMLNAWCNKLRAMGLMAGVADTSLKCPVISEGKHYCFLEIEFKKAEKSSQQSERQLMYEAAVNSVGGMYKVIRSVEEFKMFIDGLIIVI